MANINKLLKQNLGTTNTPAASFTGDDAALLQLGVEIGHEFTDSVDAAHINAAICEEIADIAEAAERVSVGIDVLLACAQADSGEGVSAYFTKRDATMINAAFAAADMPAELGATESWGSNTNVVAETEGACESVKDKALDFWKILVEKFYEFLDFIAEKTLALFGTAERLKARAEGEAKKAGAYKGEVKKDKVKVNVKLLSIGEKFSADVADVKDLTNATSKVCIEFPSKALGVFENIQKLLENEAEMVKLVADDADIEVVTDMVAAAEGAMDSGLLSAEPKFLGNFYIEQQKEAAATDLAGALAALKGTKYSIRNVKWTKDATKEMAPVASASAAEKLCEAVADLAEELIGTRTKIKDAKKFKSEIAKVQKAGEKAAKEDSLKAKSFLPKGLGTAAALYGMYANGNLTQVWMSNCVGAGNALLDYAKSAY